MELLKLIWGRKHRKPARRKAVRRETVSGYTTSEGTKVNSYRRAKPGQAPQAQPKPPVKKQPEPKHWDMHAMKKWIGICGQLVGLGSDDVDTCQREAAKAFARRDWQKTREWLGVCSNAVAVSDGPYEKLSQMGLRGQQYQQW